MIETVYLLRHGMRLDGEDEIYWPYYAKRPDDTPLCSDGMRQAQETAAFLQGNGERIDHIFSSPFFRALQTANIVAQKLNLKVNIEYGFIEQLASKWFTAFPDIIPKEEAIRVFPQINPDYQSLVYPIVPEDRSEVDVYHRVKKTFQEVGQRYDGNILVVGHGASLWEAARTFVSSRKGFNKKMGALHKFILKDGNWEFVLSTTDHLSVVDDMYDDPKLLNAISEAWTKKNQKVVCQFPVERSGRGLA